MSAGGTGKNAEQTAAAFLQKRGLRVLQKNYRSRRGEIDIIAEDGQTLVFVEVRRRGGGWGGGEKRKKNKKKKRPAAKKKAPSLGG
ncbi:MAG: YraN family protein, partial [Gammaproteobacteria bacterium]